MAVAITGTPVSGTALGGTSITVSVTVPADADCLIAIIGTGVSSGAGNTTACVFNTTETMTAITGFTRTDSNWAQVEGWYLLNPTAATANVTATTTLTNQNAISVFSLSGVDQGTPFDTAAVASGADTTPTVAVGSAVGDFVIGAVMSDSGPGFTAETGTQIVELNNIDSDAAFATQYHAGAASVTTQWTQGDSESWAIIGISINPAAGGGAAPVYNRRMSLMGVGS